MNRRLSLDRTQLKLIAIVSMFIDHTAWALLDFYTPLAQFLHVCGRLTLPITCFFVAEGFRKTHDLKRYIYRMATYAVVTIIPFYIFFHEEYDYRQNIIFDLLLGLLVLTVLESKSLAKWQKIVLTVLLFVVSAVIGGWVIEPILFTLIFYYGRSFAEKVKLFVLADVAMVAFLAIAISLNNIYHFSHYEWVWWDKFYLLGFILALPLLYCYNGEKGKDFIGRHFFYVIYPVHLLVLAALRSIVFGEVNAHSVYVVMHVLVLIMCVVLTALSFRSRPSRGQNAISFFLFSAGIYVFGFVMEVFAETSDGYYVACCIQYLGEFLTLIAALYFVAIMCKKAIPSWLMALHVVVATLLLYGLLITKSTGFFYTGIGVNNDGPFPRPELVHSTGFYLSVLFIFFICTEIVAMCINTIRTGTLLERKRVRYILLSMVFSWIPYILTLSGVTGGYEVPAIGLFLVGLFLYLTFMKIGALDSVALASENALDHGHEGILVLDSSYRIQYHNTFVDKVLGDYPHTEDARKWPIMKEILDGTRKELESGDRVYEFEIEPLIENGYEQGKMIWIIDSTEHHENMKTTMDMANHDGLTGLYTRVYFKEIVDMDVTDGREGTFIMMDLDNFKQVNDIYGHQRGDGVLKSLAYILNKYSDDEMYSCRIGGDEFCAYLRNTTSVSEIEEIIKNITEAFSKSFREEDSVICTISIGAVINVKGGNKLMTCSEMYSAADKKLYEAKNGGKNTFRI